MQPSSQDVTAVNRRDFLRGGSLATVMSVLGGVELIAPAARAADIEKLVAYTVNCGVVGLGPWGREILATLSRVKEAKIVALCDTYGPMLRRSAKDYPDARTYEDFQQMLADKDVQAVIIATATHQHRKLVEAALAAGKHVYCEAPLAHTIEDARAIAVAARAHPKFAFQAGLQFRSDKHRQFLLTFIRQGAIGKDVKASAQWHKKISWRQASPNPERERDINWRLDRQLSLGLGGEIGIHQIDLLSWFLRGRPTSVTGRGSISFWNDGRTVPDNVFALFEHSGGVFSTFEATLCNSFDLDYEMFYGTDAAVMLRADRAWMFKEADAALLGWEVYAKKDVFYRETGIALVADATKSVKQVEKAAEEVAHVGTPLYYALENFLYNANETATAVEDFAAAFNINDAAALAKHIAAVKRLPAAGWKEGFEATVLAIKTNEAITKGTRLALEPEWFEVG